MRRSERGPDGERNLQTNPRRGPGSPEPGPPRRRADCPRSSCLKTRGGLPECSLQAPYVVCATTPLKPPERYPYDTFAPRGSAVNKKFGAVPGTPFLNRALAAGAV